MPTADLDPAQPVEVTPSKGDRTRTALLEAAFRQFVANGYHGASMRAIAAEAGITAGAIYNHFAGKEDLFAAVVLAYHPFLRILPHLMAAQGQTAAALLRDAAARFVDGLQGQPEVLNLLFIELVECQGVHLAGLLEGIVRRAAPLAEKLAAAGDELKPLPPLTLLRSFFGFLIAYYVTDQLLVRAGADLDSLGDLDTHVNLYLHGVLREGADSGPAP